MIAINYYSIRFILFTSAFTVNLHRQSFLATVHVLHALALWTDHVDLPQHVIYSQGWYNFAYVQKEHIYTSDTLECSIPHLASFCST